MERLPDGGAVDPIRPGEVFRMLYDWSRAEHDVAEVRAPAGVFFDETLRDGVQAPQIGNPTIDSSYNMCAQGAVMLGLPNVDASLPDTDFAAYARAPAVGAPTEGRNAGLRRDSTATGA
jgi:hypothetical protein